MSLQLTLRQPNPLNGNIDLKAGETTGYGGVIDIGLGGSYSGGYGSDSCLTIDLCPDLLFAGLAAAAAAGFAFFYMTITGAPNVARKRRRSVTVDNSKTFFPSPNFAKFISFGMSFFVTLRMIFAS